MGGGGGGARMTLHPIPGGESKFTPSLFILMPQKPAKLRLYELLG